MTEPETPTPPRDSDPDGPAADELGGAWLDFMRRTLPVRGAAGG